QRIMRWRNRSGSSRCSACGLRIGTCGRTLLMGPVLAASIDVRKAFTSALLAIIVCNTIGCATVCSWPPESAIAHKQLETFSQAIEQFHVDLNRCPTEKEGLRALFVRPPTLVNWQSPYLSKTPPLLDPWGRPYIYRCDNSGQEYLLESLG